MDCLPFRRSIDCKSHHVVVSFSQEHLERELPETKVLAFSNLGLCRGFVGLVLEERGRNFEAVDDACSTYR